MEFASKVDILREYINSSKNIVVITGAGISVPSGIPDFRSSTGLYHTSSGYSMSPEYLLSHTCFQNEPNEFYNFYKKIIVHKDARPNLAHQYLASLENTGKLNGIITQNIDGLHTMAGSHNVVEFHGTIYKNHCTRCGASYPLSYIEDCNGVPICSKCGGVIKPDVVLYEESLDDDNIRRSIDLVTHADMLVVIGSSLVVYPAAGLINYYNGSKLVLINKSNTQYDDSANLVIDGDIIDVVSRLKE